MITASSQLRHAQTAQASPLQVQSLAGLVATWGAVILFPGFLVYHTTVAAFALPPLLAGYFGPVSLVIAVLTLLASIFAARAGSARANTATTSAMLFLFFGLLWSIGWRSYSDAFYIEEAFAQAVVSLALIGALFFIGRHITLTHWAVRTVLSCFSVVILLFLLSNYLITGNSMFDARLQFGAGDEVATYQGFATSAMLVGVLAAVGNRTQITRFTVIGCTFLSLFMLGSRSEFLGFAFGAVAFAAAVAIRSARASILVIVLSMGLFFLFMSNQFLVDESRFSELSSIDTSSSFVARLYFQEAAIDQILANPVMGVFGGHFLVLDSGSYAHNILSSWVNFGLFGFLLYTALNIIPFLRSGWEIFARRNGTPIWWAVFFLGAVVLVLSVIAKPVFWEVPGLLWGLLAQALHVQSARSASSQARPTAPMEQRPSSRPRLIRSV